MNKSPLMTVDELAKVLHKSTNRTYGLLHQGLIPGAVRLNGRWYIKRFVFEEWLTTDQNEKLIKA